MERLFGNEGRHPPYGAELTIDETTAHLAAPAELAGDLAAWFEARGIGFRHQPRAGAGGLDLLDFGDPSPLQERRIRMAFAEWRRRQPRPDGGRQRGQRLAPSASAVVAYPWP